MSADYFKRNRKDLADWLEKLDTVRVSGGRDIFPWANHYKVAAACLATLFDGLKQGTLWYYREELWQFNGSHYVKVSEEQVAAQVLEWLSNNNHPSPTSDKARRIVQAIKAWIDLTENGLRQRPDMPFWLDDRKDYYLHFSNGLVSLSDLLQGKHNLRKHDPAYFSSEGFPYGYEPDAECPLWMNHLQMVFQGDKACERLLRMWFGYCLIPDTRFQMSMFLEGDGGNGKTVCEKVLVRMVGIDRVSRVNLRQLADQFSLMLVPGCLVNICDDLGKVGGASETIFKQITGGEPIQMDRKHINPIVHRPTIRFLITMNNLPKLKDKSNAIWRRIMIMPFNYTIPHAVRNPLFIKDEREDWPFYPELPGVFNWAAEGLRDLLSTGDFVLPNVCKEAHDDWMGDSDPLRRFLVRFYELDANGLVAKEEMRSHFIEVTDLNIHPVAFVADGQLGVGDLPEN